MEGEIIRLLERWLEERKDEIVDTLKRVAAIKSVSEPQSSIGPFGSGVKQALEYVLELGRLAGFQIKNHEGYVGEIRWERSGLYKNTIGLWAHLDVVPEGEGWSSPPYEPEERDGWLFGRGVADNKSAAVGVLYILKGLRELGYRPIHDLTLFLGTNEEIGMEDISYFLSHAEAPAFSLVPDAGFPGTSGEFGRLVFTLVSELPLSEVFLDMQSGDAVNVIPDKATAILKKTDEVEWWLENRGEKDGNIAVKVWDERIEVTAHGVSGHAAMPEKAVNAIHLLMTALQRFSGITAGDREILRFLEKETEDPYGTLLGLNRRDSLSGQTVSSGTILRLEKGKPCLTHDCRFCVSDTAERLTGSIRKLAEENRFSAVIQSEKRPSYIEQEGDALRILKSAYESYTGIRQAEFPIGKGGTYAGRLPRAIATGICCPGEQKFPQGFPKGHGGAHQPDEMLPVDGYIDGLKLLAFMLLSLDYGLS